MQTIPNNNQEYKFLFNIKNKFDNSSQRLHYIEQFFLTLQDNPSLIDIELPEAHLTRNSRQQ